MLFDQNEFSPVNVKMKCKDTNDIYKTSSSFKIGIYDYCYYGSD